MDVIAAMKQDTGLQINSLKVDGGASRNNFLMQFQADIIDATVQRARIMETTALGAAYLAGLYAGVWTSKEELRAVWSAEKEYIPSALDMSPYIRKWHKAVSMCAGWEKEN
jgi:glycerol kinase